MLARTDVKVVLDGDHGEGHRKNAGDNNSEGVVAYEVQGQGDVTEAQPQVQRAEKRKVPLLFARGAAERASISQGGAARLSNLLGELDRLKTKR